MNQASYDILRLLPSIYLFILYSFSGLNEFLRNFLSPQTHGAIKNSTIILYLNDLQKKELKLLAGCGEPATGEGIIQIRLFERVEPISFVLIYKPMLSNFILELIVYVLDSS